MPNRPLADRVRSLRTAKGWTMERLAEEASVSKSYVSKLETGHYRSPSSENLIALARALGVPSDDLLKAEAPAATMPRPRARPRAVSDLLGEVARQIEATLPVLVPEVDGRAAAGRLRVAEQATEYWTYFPRDGERTHQFIAVPVVGTCLEPHIMEGHRVIVDLDATANPSDKPYVLASVEGEAVVKQLERNGGVPVLTTHDGSEAMIVDGERVQVRGVVVSVQYRP